MLPAILIIVAAIVILFIIVVALQPSEFHVARSITICAPGAAIFPQVNDFHQWTAWSPWEKLDPNMIRTYEGASSGKGAVYSWSGNKNVGAGRMTLEDSRPHEVIRLKLEFFKPFKGTNAAEFTFRANGSQTLVTWKMSGRKNVVIKAFGLFMSMDKMIGGQFEKGLANLRAVVEGKNLI